MMKMQANLKDREFKLSFADFYSKYGYIISFIVLVFIGLYFNKSFLSINNIMTLLVQASVKGVIAIGLTFAITCGLFDLSLGSQVAFIAGMGVVLYNAIPSIPLTLLFMLAFGCVLGSVNGLLVAHFSMPPFIATLATQAAYRSIITQLGAEGPFEINRAYLEQFRVVATGSLLGIPYMVWIFAIVAALGGLVLNRTKFGKYVTAIGSNANAARLAGINVKGIKTMVYVLTGCMAGLSGFLLTARLTSITAANAGLQFELDGVAAVAIGGSAMSGGRGRILGSFFGILMLQMIESILIAAAVPPFLSGLVKGIIIIVAVLIQDRPSSR